MEPGAAHKKILCSKGMVAKETDTSSVNCKSLCWIGSASCKKIGNVKCWQIFTFLILNILGFKNSQQINIYILFLGNIGRKVVIIANY